MLSEFITATRAECLSLDDGRAVRWAGHGRLEERELWSSTQMNEWFETECKS